MLKALILDRDGTLIVHKAYLSNPLDVELRPGVKRAIKLARDAGLLLFLHSNQSGVARGYFTLAQAEACTRRMIELMGATDLWNPGGPFERICHAPELPGVEGGYRKPSPKFALEVFEAYNLKPAEVCYIGDSQVDIDTARACGATHITVGRNAWCSTKAVSVLAAVTLILAKIANEQRSTRSD